MPRVSPILHRNSQKRIYKKGATYFVTSVTYQRQPYFGDPILADLFVHVLWSGSQLKDFVVHGYVVLPDHVHLLIEPRGKANYSDAMQNVKRVFSLQANQIMFSNVESAGDDIYRHLPTEQQNPYATLRWSKLLGEFHRLFMNTHGPNHLFPKFKWQKSFRDHLIRNRMDLENHISYIRNNPVKHELVKVSEDWPWMWVHGMPAPHLVHPSNLKLL